MDNRPNMSDIPDIPDIPTDDTTEYLALQSANNDPDDPFRYGWRFVPRVVNGEEVLDQVPLTLDDVLHPLEGDFIVLQHYHILYTYYLHVMLTEHLKHDPTAVVLSDVRLDLNLPGVRPIGPDLAVIFGVREQQNWGTFSCRDEGVRPSLVLEVTSPETRKHDIGAKQADNAPKFRWYAQAGIPVYIIIDFVRQKVGHPPPLLGFQLTPDGEYVPLLPNKHGHLWMAPVGLALGPRDDKIALYHADGREVDDLGMARSARDEAEQQALEAMERANAEAERANAEAERAQEAMDRAKAESERAKAEAERAQEAMDRAKAEAERANAEAERANAEAERANTALTRLHTTARALLQQGMAPAQVIELTGLSADDIASL